jgi:uncharacterized protein YbbC (DUF1343 family)
MELKKLPIILLLLISAFKLEAFNEFQIKNGIDVLIETNFELIKNKRIALLSNFSGRTRHGELSAEIMAKSDIFTLKTIFTPEHGFFSAVSAGKHVNDSEVFGVKNISLYGDNRKPKASQLKDIDIIVIDIQDIGIRSYTYISTVYKVLEAAAETGKEVIVCDRPNPLGGHIIDGNIIEKGRESFIGIIPVSYLHGCTVGELSEMIKGEKWIKHSEKLKLRVIKMQGWQREMTWEDTGLMWFPTSPNIPTVNAIRGAAMFGIFGELGIFHIGIGTSMPFQYCGVLSDVSDKIEESLEKNDLLGIVLSKTVFANSKGTPYNGFMVTFRDMDAIRPYSQGISIALAFRDALPSLFDSTKLNSNAKSMFIKACGSEELFQAIYKKASKDYVLKIANKGLDSFLKIRQKYLLYD